jgi:hypothetical protein
MIRITRPIAAAVMFVLVLGATAAAQQQPARGIVNITGQLYRAQNDNHYTVFLVAAPRIRMTVSCCIFPTNARCSARTSRRSKGCRRD